MNCTMSHGSRRIQPAPYLDQAQHANGATTRGGSAVQTAFRTTHLHEQDAPRNAQKGATSNRAYSTAAQQRPVQPIPTVQSRLLSVPPQKQSQRSLPPLQYVPSYPPRQAPPPSFALPSPSPSYISYYSRPPVTPAWSVQNQRSPMPAARVMPPQRTPISLPSRTQGYGAIRQHSNSYGNASNNSQWTPNGGQQSWYADRR